MSITSTHRRSAESPTLAKVLAAASLGLGATELLAPTLVSNVSGVTPTRGVRNVIRALGVRELAHGFALSASPASAWTRVAGDVLDVAMLAVGHRTHPTNEKRGLVAAGLLTGIAGIDVIASRRYARAA